MHHVCIYPQNQINWFNTGLVTTGPFGVLRSSTIAYRQTESLTQFGIKQSILIQTASIGQGKRYKQYLYFVRIPPYSTIGTYSA